MEYKYSNFYCTHCKQAGDVYLEFDGILAIFACPSFVKMLNSTGYG